MNREKAGRNLKRLVIGRYNEINDFVSQIGVSYDTVMKWFSGKSWPLPRYHDIIKSALGLPGLDLYHLDKLQEVRPEDMDEIRKRLDELERKCDKIIDFLDGLRTGANLNPPAGDSADRRRRYQ